MESESSHAARCGTHETDTDRCPGALTPWIADDGAIVRVRTAGGRMRTEQLLAVSELAQEFGTGDVYLTGRGNVQIRGLADPLPSEVQQRLLDADLLPSLTHERVRNIIAPPSPQLDDLINDLDETIQADPQLAELPGRFAFAFADAAGVGFDVPFDLGFQRQDASVGVLVVGHVAVRVPVTSAASLLADAARKFLEHRPDRRTWNVKDLPTDNPLFEWAQQQGTPVAVPAPAPWPLPPTSVGAPLGMLAPAAVRALHQVCDELVVMPNRTMMLRQDHADGSVRSHDVRHSSQLDRKPLYVTGLVVSGDSGYNQISACIGAPACRRTSVKTVALAHDLAVMTQVGPTIPRVHISGCERMCGHPHGEHVAVVNPSGVDEVLAQLDLHPTT